MLDNAVSNVQLMLTYLVNPVQICSEITYGSVRNGKLIHTECFFFNYYTKKLLRQDS